MKEERKMKATEILKEEHRVIERVLASLDKGTLRLEKNEPINSDFFIETCDFIKGFADGCHHKKEEQVLFKTLIANGMPAENSPVAVMLAEHDEGRTYTRLICEAANRLKSDDETAIDTIVENARRYTALLRQHIMKEDQILFPMADRIIPLSLHDQVLDDFEKVEHEETGAGVHEKYLALAETLESQVTN
jgi:hemerythrin-like domain-containing protein